MTHRYWLTGTTPGGRELYECPRCGRAVAVRWRPWSKQTLVEGDPLALHAGGKGGLSVGALTVEEGE